METLNLFIHPADFVTVNAGDIIFEQDQVSETMYVLIEGEVVIQRDGENVVTLGPKTILGEMAILENRPHFASAIAKTICQLIPISQERFRFLVEQTPNFAFDMMTMMAERLHQMNIKAIEA
ncbi:cNMP-binding protein [Leptolyngbya sp. PCC 7375]|nr:cNMP-binding protein [Leptolyngbya sp. PCC 7375]